MTLFALIGRVTEAWKELVAQTQVGIWKYGDVMNEAPGAPGHPAPISCTGAINLVIQMAGLYTPYESTAQIRGKGADDGHQYFLPDSTGQEGDIALVLNGSHGIYFAGGSPQDFYASNENAHWYGPGRESRKRYTGETTFYPAGPQRASFPKFGSEAQGNFYPPCVRVVPPPQPGESCCGGAMFGPAGYWGFDWYFLYDEDVETGMFNPSGIASWFVWFPSSGSGRATF